ncbi:hypothetical protein G6549_24495 [Bacillus sp. MM2020_1]|nr:hypothetical protein [Bacillus sp. MM2020_1]
MQEKKRSKKPFVLGTLAVLVIAVIAVIIFAQHDTKQKEEMWAFRDTLDKSYFPLRDEFEACVYPSKTTSKDYNCYKQDILEQYQQVKEHISSYEVTSDDAKKLKNEVLNGLDIINKTTKDLDASDSSKKTGTLNSDEVRELVNNIGKLTDDKKDFYKNADKIYNILVPKYYSK